MDTIMFFALLVTLGVIAIASLKRGSQPMSGESGAGLPGKASREELIQKALLQAGPELRQIMMSDLRRQEVLQRMAILRKGPESEKIAQRLLEELDGLSPFEQTAGGALPAVWNSQATPGPAFRLA